MPRRRRQWTDEEKASLVAAFHAAGMCLDAFARERDVPASTLWNWLHGRGTALNTGGVPQLIEVVPRAVPQATTGACRLVLGTDAHLELAQLPPARWLAELAAELRSC